jgi:hypothetical protein
MEPTPSPQDFQTAIDFAILKRRLEKLRTVTGLVGFLALLHGAGPRNSSPATAGVGLLLIAEAIAPSIVMSPIHLIIFGLMAVVFGAAMNLVPAISISAGGSAGGRAIMGWGIAFLGLKILSEYRWFSHLKGQSVSKANFKHADAFVRNLRPANPKKDKDVILAFVGPCPDHAHQASPELQADLARNIGRWKARLLPNVAVLLKEDARHSLVIAKSNFAMVQVNKGRKFDQVSFVRIGGYMHSFLTKGDSSLRIAQWLGQHQEEPS